MADTIVKRVGGKIKIRKWIKSLFPIHSLYCEPFGGSFAVGFLMPKQDAKYRLVYNDLDGNVWNLFKVLRDHEKEFIRMVSLTPYSRREFDEANDYIDNKKFLLKDEPVEWARNYLVYNRQCMFGKEDGSWCVSRVGENICLTWANLPSLIKDNIKFLRNVYIENLDYKKCIEKWDCPEALFYLDPPYEGVEKDFYKVNKKEGFDHVDFSKFVKTVKGSCAISYYDSEFVRNLYQEKDGFTIYEKSVVKSMQTKKEKDTVTELLIVKESNWAKSVEKSIF